MYDNILLPVDGSPAAEQAIPHVFGLAEQYDATVHVLFVVNTNRDNVGIVGGTVLEALEQEGQQVVDEVVSRGEERGIEIIGDVTRGAPHEAILDYADDNEVEVIVMATHGRTGVERVLLGSVTERVVRTSPVPVLTVRASE
ncbi:universal stress protein [Haloferax mediterranei ATCC 33500]|uniref:Universal stress protein n=1 Tax=Haloferax mediterranei (strain ATCC 33500 / DSM 1411 / JCM 8866 / NBRC 14739 / NCIMB 2177 / R-4) TaxID=523841 RepID=I3R429_HALMT|nr:universal stress protein [Haloferax mediterranei]AFK18989.1 universal stress protein UspA-like protein [Haloferax mediterranei ATCC 33500]AHZ21652.1 universal stress protein UspA [Haloferax mediterranei ATCC 33500]EMA03153.1 universal stress protein UspA-like protein [Haloferax mediterranei ATCC 33500]MDX5989080.1 universal stress protein [Haloferax mediterranei ATCC 33500]QCQ75469.1 universal stress protein [Haloferax mediterranei ATCC 33500]